MKKDLRGLQVRVTGELPLGSIKILSDLAKYQDCTLRDALRRAVATEKIIQQAIRDGGRVLIQNEDGGISQLEFHR